MNQMPFPVPDTDDKLLWETWMSSFNYPAVQIAMEAGIFKSLNQEPKTTSEAGKALGYSFRSMESLLGLLTALGFLNRIGGKFYLNRVSETYLLEDSPFFWGGIMDYRTDDQTRVLLREMLEKEKTGKTGTEMNENWEQGKMAPEKAEKFTRAMHSTSVAPASVLSKKLNLEGFNSLLDVAGGSGSYAMALASANPNLKATVMELPEVVPYTRKFIQKFGLDKKVNAIAGNLFDVNTWPSQHDVHFYSHIFHDWDEDTCRMLAGNSYTTLNKGGRIVLHEILLDDSADSNATSLAFSLKMLISMKGKQYRFEELKDFLTKAGFVNIETFPVFGYFSVVTGEKAA